MILGARIYVLEASIWHLKASLPEKKKKRLQLWLNKIKRVDWTKPSSNMIAFAAHTSYQKRFNKVLSFIICLKISCISRLCCVLNNVCVHVCKTANWRFICFIICNFIYKACTGRPIRFRPLKLTFSNNSRGPGQWVTLHMQVKSEFIQLLLKKQANKFHSKS